MSGARGVFRDGHVAAERELHTSPACRPELDVHQVFPSSGMRGRVVSQTKASITHPFSRRGQEDQDMCPGRGGMRLFLAGADRQIDDGAEFAVHSWIDAHGRQPQDFSMNAAPNRMYLDFYREMGMSNAEARAFYNMTNSVSFKDARFCI